MNAIVKQVNPPDEPSDFRKAANRFTVYTDGKARNVADREYLTKYQIFNLDFRCASWNRVAKFATDIEAAAAKKAIEEKFGVKVELKFSRTAGCSCGCSPGYVGKILDSNSFAARHGGTGLSRANVWIGEEITSEDEASIVAFAAKQAVKLPAEIAVGNAKVAAEKIAAEERKAAEIREREEWRAYRATQDLKWAQQRADESLLCAAL